MSVYTDVGCVVCSYQIMLECWNEDLEDRPTFAELRERFGHLILAGKEGLYIDLQVDEMKPYYVIKDEEEEKRPRLRAGSIEKAKEGKEGKEKAERIASRNPYVEGPTRRLDDTEQSEETGDVSQSVPRTDERLGISIAMLASEQARHEGLERRTTNPYVDNPSRVPIAGEIEVHAETPLEEHPEVTNGNVVTGDHALRAGSPVSEHN